MPKKLTAQQFIEKALSVHGNKYDYSKVNYINSSTKVTIICPEHGEFKQVPSSHLRGYSCFNCKGASKLSTENFINKAKKINEDKYDYSKTVYVNAVSKVTITCPIHGDFEQNSKAHLRGQQCPNCIIDSRRDNPTGWNYTNWVKAANKSKHFDSFKVYIIKCWNENEEFYKIGKTFKKLIKRFESKKDMPYNYEVVKIFEGESNYICSLEKQLQKEHKQYKYIPKVSFSGMYECFNNIDK